MRCRLLLQQRFLVVVSLIFCRCFKFSFGLQQQQQQQLLLLSNLPTPAFLINVDFVQQKQHNNNNNIPKSIISPILLPSSQKILIPVQLDDVTCPFDIDSTAASSNNDDDDDDDIINCAGTCYWHASVVRSRGGDDNADTDTTRNTFLAELDMPAAMVESSLSAQLVLGLNNHHVGSYYWARSAGAGAAMEAPGIQLVVTKRGNNNIQDDDVSEINDHDNKNSGYSCCSLYWASKQGPTACNSNDGKRSEWVNFLRPNDQVQLIPLQAEQSILQWIKELHNPSLLEAATKADASSSSLFSLGRIFGVSNYKRPLGSEPAVVCEWKLQE